MKDERVSSKQRLPIRRIVTRDDMHCLQHSALSSLMPYMTARTEEVQRPEVQARPPTLLKQFPMDPNGTLTLQEPDRVGHAVLGRYAQAQVDVVRHRLPFQQFDSALTAQLPKNWANLMPQPSLEDFPAALRYHHYVVLALPPHMGQALPFVHRLLLPAPRGLPGRRSLCLPHPNARRIARSSSGHTARGHRFRTHKITHLFTLNFSIPR